MPPKEASPRPPQPGTPGLGDGRERGATTKVDVATGPITGTTFRFTITDIEEATSLDWFSHDKTVLPVGIAELGLPVTRPQLAADTAVPSTCRTDLVNAGGTPVPMRVV